MHQPFFAAANRVIRMYALRQERASAKAPAHSPAEIYWACEMLLNIARAAAYAASKEEVAIRVTAALWIKTGTAPEFFSEVEEAQS
ncbi:hypothetical protein [Edaphovirga cremea]|uniref:hypothetical protein n=1 Tax=Edaphovirga cremea TaxID=2267246 RepID=UPI0039891B38